MTASLSVADDLPPVALMRTLFSYPYCNLIPQYFGRTRDFEAGLRFVDCCSELLRTSGQTVPQEEAARIGQQFSMLELSLLDHLNRWEEYLALFATLRARQDLTLTYSSTCDPGRFGNYLLGRRPDGTLLVHQLYLQDPRRQMIARKLRLQAAGKSVDHLKRHQRERLAPEELSGRYEELERLFSWMKRREAETRRA